VRFPRFAGDAAMQLPILRLLRQMGIGPIVVWGPASTVCLALGNELADFALPEQYKLGILELTKILKANRAARSIHFPKSLRAPIAAWLAGVPERVGVSDGGAKFFNTHHAPFWKAQGPFVLRYHAALAKLWPNLPQMPFSEYKPSADRLDNAYLPNGNYICLMPGSLWPSKAWPLKHFHALAERAIDEGLEVVVLGSGAERPLGESVLADIAPFAKGHNLCGQTDLPQAASLLQGAMAAIGNDSGLSHLAAACGAKTIAIYGPTDPGGSAPWGPNVSTLCHASHRCRPCFKRTCPLKMRACMDDILPEEVFGKVVSE
jgi:heptosyltransferase-2